MPTRYLKPGIRDSDLIDVLSPMAEIMFYRLLVTVDDFGRFDARPAMLKSQCFPIKEGVSAKTCDALLKELSESGLISVYLVDGKPYLQIEKWDNKPRATESKFPEHSAGCIQMYADVCNQRTLVPLTVTVTETETKTDNRKPEQKQDAIALPPSGVSIQTWKDWLQLRKTKRAPVTQTVIAGAIKEAEKAGMQLEEFLQIWCRRGSQGLEASWLKPDELKSSGVSIKNRQEQLEARNREVVARMMAKENQSEI